MTDVSERHEPDSASARATRIMLRPIATPFPLGFSALATASLMVAGTELGWFASSDRDVIALVLIGFAFPLQMIASVFGFLGRDTAAATGFGVQGATWLIVGLNLLLTPLASTSPALGVLLCAAAAWVTLCSVGAAMGKLVPAFVMMLTALRFLLTGLYELSAAHGLEHAAAIVGLVLVALCGYAVISLELENLQRTTVLPLLRRGAGREAMSAGLLKQSENVEHEAGAREQL